jgi:hypothetical protein
MSAAGDSKRTAETLEDYLDEDEPVGGQKYALVSFLSPENVLEKKELFFFERFLQSYEVDWKIKNLETFLGDTVAGINRALEERAVAFDKEGNTEQAELCRKSRVKIDPIMADYQTYVRQQQKQINKTKIREAWEDFLFREQAKLEEEFHARNNFRTTIRGFKVRGVARDEHEAQVRAKKLQARDRYHNIYCAEVGKWTPWDPKPHLIAEQEYAQEELNALMKKYRENEDSKAMFFEEQRRAGVPVPAAGAGATAAPAKTNSISIEAIKDAATGGAGAGAGATEAPANVVLEGAAPIGAYNSVFEGPADLVMARKAEAAAAAAATAAPTAEGTKEKAE